MFVNLISTNKASIVFPGVDGFENEPFLFPELVDAHLPTLTDEPQTEGFDIHRIVVDRREDVAAIGTVLREDQEADSLLTAGLGKGFP